VQVVKGDVSVKTDVEKVVQEAHHPIRGVVQGAMVLQDKFFDQMNVEDLDAVLRCKVQGTVNLHEVLSTEPLDFFLMMSSVSAVAGVATQSNYNAACAFLDSFARYRNHLGLRAVSLALGMVLEVGYVAENPHVEKALVRNGICPIWEHEFLTMVDAALSNQLADTISDSDDPWAKSHIITGLEPSKLVELTRRGYAGATFLLEDPRFGAIMMAAEENYRNSNRVAKHIDKDYHKNFHLDENITTLQIILERFSKLVFQPIQQLDPRKSPSDYGMDSMIGAEFRNWFFKSFHAEVSFLEILSPTVTFEELAERALREVAGN
jgi:hypothetical protein